MNKYLYMGMGAAFFFAAGYYMNKTPTAVMEENKQKVEQQVKTRTIIVEKIAKDGSVEKKTEVVQDVDTKQETIKQTETKYGSGVYFGAIAGFDFDGRNLVYGAEVHKKVFGPVYIGAFGLTNKTVGVNVGLEF